MAKQKTYISCPKCGWEPDGGAYWVCSDCKTKWNTFDTHAECPTCGRVYEDTACPRTRGGCGQMSQHKDWYISYIEPKDSNGVFSFLKKGSKLPISSSDKTRVELSLLWLADKLDRQYFQSLNTITPQSLYAKFDFKNTEEDAEFLLREIGNIVNVDTSAIKFVFLSDVSDAIPEDELIEIALASTGHEESKANFEPVPNVLWVSVYWLRDVDVLVVKLAQKLLRRKILIELNARNIYGPIVSLASVVFGFGIFMTNAYYNFINLQNDTYRDWRHNEYGFPPEQVIAYAMAWLVHYRKQDTTWKQYLNKTTLRFFEESYQYIEINNDMINW